MQYRWAQGTLARLAGWTVAAVLVVALAVAPARAGDAPPCAGDCDADGEVSIVELLRCLRIALDLSPVSACPASDRNGDGRVDIAELNAAVHRALNGCIDPTPTATPNPSSSPTRSATPSRTPTPSRTITRTRTVTPTRSVTATASTTPTVTDTPTDTPPPPPSGTEAPTATATPSASASPSATATHTVTGTSTPTPTLTPVLGLSSRACGNGTLEPGEPCDDGNRVAGDGCDASCRSELHPDPCAEVTPVAGDRLALERVVGGLRQPLYVTAPPRDPTRIFIVEQRGRIRIIEHGVHLNTSFLDMSTRIVAGGERGLLGLAFHPLYADNGQFFIAYTALRGGDTVSVVSRFRVSADPNVADPTSEEIILELLQPFTTHNGGQLAFDAEGYLLTSFGDGGRSASTQNHAQNLSGWFGKILRLDVDAAVPYAIPADNPFAAQSGVRPEIWAYGLRNPWRFSIDPVTGDVFIGDVGEGRREEVDVVPGGGAGANFGWCCREGTLPFGSCFQQAMTCPAPETLAPPLVEYDHATGCSVTGGFVYRGCALPDLRGTYFYADFCAGFVRSFVYRDGQVTDERDWTEMLTGDPGTGVGGIAGFGQDAHGELYLADLVGNAVYKLVPAPGEPE